MRWQKHVSDITCHHQYMNTCTVTQTQRKVLALELLHNQQLRLLQLQLVLLHLVSLPRALAQQ
jgi:hypothetical protein